MRGSYSLYRHPATTADADVIRCSPQLMQPAAAFLAVDQLLAADLLHNHATIWG